jgi:hypothetical protein
MNVTLRQLRAFVEVGKRRSFTSAARHLHLTQSALSHLIRQLETQLAVRLIGAFHYLVDRAASQAGVPVAPAYEVGYMERQSARLPWRAKFPSSRAPGELSLPRRRNSRKCYEPCAHDRSTVSQLTMAAPCSAARSLFYRCAQWVG